MTSGGVNTVGRDAVTMTWGREHCMPFCPDGAGIITGKQQERTILLFLPFKILIRFASKAGARQKQIVDLKTRRTNKMPPDKERKPPLYLTAINMSM